MDTEIPEITHHLPTPQEKLEKTAQRLANADLKQEVINDALVIAKDPLTVPVTEIDQIVSFVRSIEDEDLRGKCSERTAESVFAGLAHYGWERQDSDDNSGIIPTGLHIISGKELPNGKLLAFDTIARGIIFQEDDKPSQKPLAQTIVFMGNSEDEMKSTLYAFYGGNFAKEEIEDTPAERFVAQRKPSKMI